MARGTERGQRLAWLSRLVGDDDGQDLIEYGLLLGVITVAAVVAVMGIGAKVGAIFTSLRDALP